MLCKQISLILMGFTGFLISFAGFSVTHMKSPQLIEENPTVIDILLPNQGNVSEIPDAPPVDAGAQENQMPGHINNDAINQAKEQFTDIHMQGQNNYTRGCHMKFKKTEINDDNFAECIVVLKSILWLYHSIVKDGMITHNLDYDQINYSKYIFCEITDERLKTPYEENIIEIVNQGCLIALCCFVSDQLDEHNINHDTIDFIEQLLDIDIQRCDKKILIAAREVLLFEMNSDVYQPDWTKSEKGEIYYNSLNELFHKYVLGYYSGLLHGYFVSNDTIVTR